jgi:hypothetical protein
MPSSSVRSTSVRNPRIVRVTGAAHRQTIIPVRWSMTSSRVSTRTGRRLSGSRNVYQRISPRVKEVLPNRRLPTRAVCRRLRTRFLLGAQRCRPIYPCRGAKQSIGAAGLARCPAEMPQAALCRLRSVTPASIEFYRGPPGTPGLPARFLGGLSLLLRWVLILICGCFDKDAKKAGYATSALACYVGSHADFVLLFENSFAEPKHRHPHEARAVRRGIRERRLLTSSGWR